MQINVLDYLERSTILHPKKIAFSDTQDSISYLDLLNKAKKLGSLISKELNGLTNQPIGVIIDRNISSLIMFFGVVYSGNFYIPLNIALPSLRISSIIETLRPGIILTNDKDKQIFNEIKYTGKLIEFNKLDSQDINEHDLKAIRKKIIDTDPLYAMFTSGSTGKPKGVLISHRSVIDLIDNFSNIFNFSDKSIFGNQAPFDFDVSVKDIYSTLCNSGCMHILEKGLFSFPHRLIEILNEKKINTIIWATSALRIIENLKVFDSIKPKYLEIVMFSGEVMPNKILNYWRDNLESVTYVNLYGPTEITCNCSYFIVDRPFSNNEMLPIGISFPNTDILILDKNNKNITGNNVGEICVRGSSLALGYYNNFEETEKSFVQNPLNNNYPELIYKTGDLGSYNEHGEIMFRSRKDNQIKHHGYRIELGEIEVAANSHVFVEAAVCFFDEKAEKIILFYQSKNSDDKNIIKYLNNLLPRYMVPEIIKRIEKFPLNKNSKIDRNELWRIYKLEEN